MMHKMSFDSHLVISINFLVAEISARILAKFTIISCNAGT